MGGVFVALGVLGDPWIDASLLAGIYCQSISLSIQLKFGKKIGKLLDSMKNQMILLNKHRCAVSQSK